LPGYANINGSITIRQILNHTSGIYDYDENDDFGKAAKISKLSHKIWTKQEILQTYIGPPDFAAGTSWHYSNTNYLIAGFIAESITGKSIHELIRDSILIPQSLDHTFFPPYETTTETFAHFWCDLTGYGTLNDLSDSTIKFSYYPIEFYSTADAAGALVSTAEDNVLFWKALMNGKIISTSTLKNKMLQFCPTSVDLASRGDIGYGLGIIKTKLSIGDTLVSHSGWVHGQINLNLADTMNNIYITVLSNQDFVDPQPVLVGLYKTVLDYSLVGINENSSLTKMDFTIYPNPADKVLNIEINNLGRQELEIEIYTVTGEVIYQKKYDNIDSNFVSQLDLSGYAKGIYLVKIKQFDTVYVGKVVVR
jgi:D-alanyl-D-alanine carboxypeptidase